MSTHTPGPWKLHREPLNTNVYIIGTDGALVVTVNDSAMYQMYARPYQANARRIVAAVNAAEEAGLSTEALEKGAVKALKDAAESMNKLCSDQRYLCTELVHSITRAALAKAEGKG